MSKQMTQVFAVVRIDRFDDPVDRTNIQTRITVTRVLPTLEDALSEVERLNYLNEDKGAHYFWQATRFYPDGREGASGTSDTSH